MQIVENNILTEQILDKLFPLIRDIKVVIIGDFCVDIYWIADMRRSVLSRETPHYPLPIVQERTSPGAAGNVAANLKALGVKNVNVIGVIGSDWRGECLKSEFRKRDIPTEGLCVDSSRFTNAYCKPMKKGYMDVEVEESRLDFENFYPISCQTESNVIEMLDKLTEDADVLLVCDQFTNGCVTQKVRNKIIELAENGLMVFVDSRSGIEKYRNAILKPNDLECAIAVGVVPDSLTDIDSKIGCAKKLAEKCDSTVCMTLGDQGSVIVDKSNVVLTRPFSVEGPVDVVGAGDCFLSAFASALAVGENFKTATLFANLASSIAVKQIGTTGVARPEDFYNSIAARK